MPKKKFYHQYMHTNPFLIHHWTSYVESTKLPERCESCPLLAMSMYNNPYSSTYGLDTTFPSFYGYSQASIN